MKSWAQFLFAPSREKNSHNSWDIRYRAQKHIASVVDKINPKLETVLVPPTKLKDNPQRVKLISVIHLNLRISEHSLRICLGIPKKKVPSSNKIKITMLDIQ